MIFPLGMYTACTIKLSQAIELPFLMWIPSFFIYIALIAWWVAIISMFYSIGRDYFFSNEPAKS